MVHKFEVGQVAYYMYINMMCKCRIRSAYEKDGTVYYDDGTNNAIMEKYLFRTKEQLFDFHSGRKRKDRT